MEKHIGMGSAVCVFYLKCGARSVTNTSKEIGSGESPSGCADSCKNRHTTLAVLDPEPSHAARATSC